MFNITYPKFFPEVKKKKKIHDSSISFVYLVPNIWIMGNFQTTNRDTDFWFCQSGLMRLLPFKCGA